MNNLETPTEEDMLNALGAGPAEPEAPPEPEPPAPEADPQPQPPEPQPQPESQPHARPAEKSNQAFARMRTENAQMQKALNKMASVLGVDGKLPADQLLAQLDSKLTESLAKQRNMDPEFLKRLEALEADHAELESMRLAQRTQESLTNIQKKYGATDEDLDAFADTLIKEGVDIKVSGFDLEQEFIKRNFQKILDLKVNEAVKAEQLRASKASGASVPGDKQGKSSGSDDSKPINTVADLEQFLQDNIK